jgi:hypothetical protein
VKCSELTLFEQSHGTFEHSWFPGRDWKLIADFLSITEVLANNLITKFIFLIFCLFHEVLSIEILYIKLNECKRILNDKC